MIVSIALIIGLVLILSALILLLSVAFKTDFIWGLLGLLIVPLFIFMLVYPGKSKYTIALLLIGVTASGLALWGGADQVLGLKAKAEALGIAELPGVNLLRPLPEVKPVPQEVVEEATVTESKSKPKVKVKKTKRRSRYREASAGELKHLSGALFKGTTYDGRTIQGRIVQANEDEITLSRSVSQGSASFNYRLTEFKEFMVANP